MILLTPILIVIGVYGLSVVYFKHQFETDNFMKNLFK